jgi:hypothetical protein
VREIQIDTILAITRRKKLKTYIGQLLALISRDLALGFEVDLVAHNSDAREIGIIFKATNLRINCTLNTVIRAEKR